MSSPDSSSIREQLTAPAADKLDRLDVFDSIASTNSYLLAQPAPAPGRFAVAIADHQTAGRGRRDRRWISAPGASICLSLAYTFAKTPTHLPALTLAIGVAVVDALQHLGITGVSLKWPNDIVTQDGKLGGILTEAQSTAGSVLTVVTGIGVNLNLPEDFSLDTESDWMQSPVDLQSVHSSLPARDRLAGTIIEYLFRAVSQFEQSGFTEFAEEWQRHDWLRDRKTVVETPDERIAGIAVGVDEEGALLIEGEGGLKRVISGTVVKTDRLR